jgi:hypothetical protein
MQRLRGDGPTTCKKDSVFGKKDSVFGDGGMSAEYLDHTYVQLIPEA